MTSWQLSYSTDDGSTWETAYNIENGTDDVIIQRNSNIIKKRLIDGSEAFQVPETKFLYENVEFNWMHLFDDSVIMSDNGSELSLKTIFENAYRFRIINHDGEIYEGYMATLPYTYKHGQYIKPDNTYATLYDVSCIMHLISVS